MTDIIRTTTNFVDSWVANVVQINTVTILQAPGCSKGGYPGWGGGGYSWEFLVGGMPAGSPNPDPISDQRCNFSHPFFTPVFRPGL